MGTATDFLEWMIWAGVDLQDISCSSHFGGLNLKVCNVKL